MHRQHSSATLIFKLPWLIKLCACGLFSHDVYAAGMERCSKRHVNQVLCKACRHCAAQTFSIYEPAAPAVKSQRNLPKTGRSFLTATNATKHLNPFFTLSQKLGDHWRQLCYDLSAPDKQLPRLKLMSHHFVCNVCELQAQVGNRYHKTSWKQPLISTPSEPWIPASAATPHYRGDTDTAETTQYRHQSFSMTSLMNSNAPASWTRCLSRNKAVAGVTKEKASSRRGSARGLNLWVLPQRAWSNGAPRLFEQGPPHSTTRFTFLANYHVRILSGLREKA